MADQAEAYREGITEAVRLLRLWMDVYDMDQGPVSAESAEFVRLWEEHPEP